MLFETSEEGPTACLSVLRGKVVRFRDKAMVGAGRRAAQGAAHGLEPGPAGDGTTRCGRASPTCTRFYFAHSYHPEPDDPALTAGTADYPLPFTCAVAGANIFATQFHPEKSQSAGLRLLANFVVWNGYH